MLQTILFVVMIVISLAMTGVILLQRSEGGALGMGGGPSGFMTARGAGNLLTRVTAVLGTLFFICAISLTIVGNMERAGSSVASSSNIGAIDLSQQPTTAPAEAAPTETAPAETGPSLDDLESSFGQAPAQPAPAQ